MADRYDDITHLLSSALLVDVDLSRWDEMIRFVVSVDPDEEFGPTSDLYNFDCLNASSLSWNADSMTQVDGRPGIHARVQLWRVLISERDENVRVELRTSGPTVVVECMDVRLLVSDTKLASIVDPDWFRPGHQFARGSLEHIAARLTAPTARPNRG